MELFDIGPLKSDDRNNTVWRSQFASSGVYVCLDNVKYDVRYCTPEDMQQSDEWWIAKVQELRALKVLES